MQLCISQSRRYTRELAIVRRPCYWIGPAFCCLRTTKEVISCTSGSCVLAGQSADGDSEESVTINNPAAGTWVVLIDGFAVPAGTTTYNYVDVFVNPAFGAISVTDANALRP